MDYDRMDPEMRRLRMKAVLAYKRGDIRQVADLTMQAVVVAPDKWAYGRYFLLHSYGDCLMEFKHIASGKDKKAYKKILNSEEEPALFRVISAFSLSCLFGMEDREQVADYLRQALEVAQMADSRDDNRRVFVPHNEDDGDDLNPTVKDEMNRLVNLVKLNLRVCSNPHTINTEEYRRELNKAESVRCSDGTTLKMPYRDYSFPSVSDPELQRRLNEVGGNECDCCKRTLQELGVPRLNCCTRCQLAYYCGRECQRKQWKAGHKTTCRKPGEIYARDIMRIRGVKAEAALNDKVVIVLEKDQAKEGRWIVFVLGSSDRRISLATEKLAHIRPAK